MNFNTPILFSTPEQELESLKLLADAIFQTRYPQSKTVYDVFPELARFIETAGQPLKAPMIYSRLEDVETFERARLSDYVEQVFRIAPHMVRNLIQQPPVSSDHSIIQNMTVEKIPLPEPSPRQEPENNAKGSSLRVSVKSNADRAYSLTQLLLDKVYLKIIGEAVYHYTGTHYAFLSVSDLKRLIVKFCRSEIQEEGNGRLIEAIYKLLIYEPRLCQETNRTDPHLISCTQGVYDLDTHQVYPHSPRFCCFYSLTGHPRLGSHPVFNQFLENITNGDAVLRQRILEIIGYCLTPDLGAKAFFVFQGVPDSGKSVLASFIQHCFNSDAYVATEINALSDRFAASTLIGKQLCLAMDLPSTPLNAKAVSTFKMLTGGDPITADIKYLPPATFHNTAKFIFGTNHPLYTCQVDPAFERRAIVVPFAHSISREKQDRDLLKKIDAERDFIIHTALHAYDELRSCSYQFSGDYQLNELFEGHYSTPHSIEATLREFISTRCKVDSSATEFIQNLYTDFCNSYPLLNLAQNEFSFRFFRTCSSEGLLVTRGAKKRITPDGNPQATIIGVRLRNDS